MRISSKVRFLIPIAHYDDEILSCAGLIMSFSKVCTIDVVAITNKSEAHRRHFFEVCEKMGVNRAESLDFPLWDDPATKHLASIERAKLLDAMEARDLKPEKYDVLVTHAKDGDIDFHEHHKQVFKALEHIEVPSRLSFVAFPRLGLAKGHKLYDWTEKRRYWYDYLKEGFLPVELAKKTNYIVSLDPEQVKRKQSLFKIYFPHNVNYVCVQYPMELFYESSCYPKQ